MKIGRFIKRAVKPLKKFTINIEEIRYQVLDPLNKIQKVQIHFQRGSYSTEIESDSTVNLEDNTNIHCFS